MLCCSSRNLSLLTDELSAPSFALADSFGRAGISTEVAELGRSYDAGPDVEAASFDTSPSCSAPPSVVVPGSSETTVFAASPLKPFALLASAWLEA